MELPALWIDIDDAKPLDVLLGVMFPPSIVVDSGGGLHAYWLLTEPEDTKDVRLVPLLRRLKDVFGGDPAVCDVARIMRLPGTHNTKRGDRREVAIVHQSEARYNLPDIEEWLSWQPQLRGEPVNPFLAAAERLGVRGSLDVDALLAGMKPGNIHDTLLRASASLASSGKTEDEIVETLMPAVRLACGEEGRRWDWQREESSLRKMIQGARSKFASNVVPMRKPVEQAVPKAEQRNQTGKVGAVGMEAWGRPLIAVDGDLWTYEGGVWWPMDGGREHMLRTCIQGAAEALGIEAKTGLLNSAWRWIVERPGHVKTGVEWDHAGVVVGTNGALRLSDGAVIPHSQEHYATRRVGCDIAVGADCPIWRGFLADAMSQECVDALQEWFGSALVRGKPREMTKGLVIYGPSYTGKTQVAMVMRALLCGRTCGLSVRSLSERFGREPLITASGWIADDAVGQNETMDAESYKVIVTGESVSVERKNRASVEIAFDLPVLLTMNNYPRVKDNSDAVYNRTMVLPMTMVRSERSSRPIAREVIEAELAGVICWAVEGWRRLSARGWFEVPDAMVAASRDFKDHNNPFGEFTALCVETSPDHMVMRRDFLTAFNSWLKIEIEARSEWSGKAVANAIKHGLPKVSSGRAHNGDDRVWIGVKFKPAALEYLNSFGSERRGIADVNFFVPKEKTPSKSIF